MRIRNSTPPTPRLVPRALRRRASALDGLRSIGLALFCCLWIAGCDAPRWSVSTEPAGARALVDGREIPVDQPADRALPYYGTYDLGAVPDPTDPSGQSTIGRATWQVRPPVTGWLFPFDFAVETLGAAFGTLEEEHSRSISTGRRTERIVPDVRPASVEDLRVRAAIMATER